MKGKNSNATEKMKLACLIKTLKKKKIEYKFKTVGPVTFCFLTLGSAIIVGTSIRAEEDRLSRPYGRYTAMVRAYRHASMREIKILEYSGAVIRRLKSIGYPFSECPFYKCRSYTGEDRESRSNRAVECLIECLKANKVGE